MTIPLPPPTSLRAIAACLAALCMAGLQPAAAQDAIDAVPDIRPTIADPPLAPAEDPAAAPEAPATPSAPERTTVIPRTPAEAASEADVSQVRLVAQLTADGQYIDQGLVWRIFQAADGNGGKAKLVNTSRDASPTLKLKSGDYLVNAAFGRAHLTRKITVKPGAPAVEPFVLNAGGFRVTALVGTAPAPQNSVTYSIFSDRDQSDNRKLILNAAKPGVIIRLNAGIYHVVSTYGDANAIVRSDVNVEAGKLTETTITHAAAKATFKLVKRAGGEAVPGTQWSILDPAGETVKESVGALPTHILAPGTYTAVAKSQGAVYQREFTVTDGEITQVEVVIR